MIYKEFKLALIESSDGQEMNIEVSPQMMKMFVQMWCEENGYELRPKIQSIPQYPYTLTPASVPLITSIDGTSDPNVVQNSTTVAQTQEL